MIRWRVRTMLGLVALAALIAWGVHLRRRGDDFLKLALRESGARMKLSMLAFHAERKVIGFKQYERTLDRGGILSVFTGDTAQEREANRAFLVEAEAWWSGRIAEYQAQADDHRRREVRFQQAASRPWESLPPEWVDPEADRLRRIALEHAELESMCRDHVDGCKGRALKSASEARKPPASSPDRREESARQVEAALRGLREGLIQADWHAAMRRKYRHAASHPGEPLPPDPPDPNLVTTGTPRPWLPPPSLTARESPGSHP